MKIAIIGSGISGLTAAFQLNKKHDITLYEAENRLGGHTATKTVTTDSGTYAIDTGFIVFNDWTYPNFINLLNQINVQSQPAPMGFSAFYTDGRFEYSGAGLNSFFADRRTLLCRDHWRMLSDILRFNKEAPRDWRERKLSGDLTLGQYLQSNGYSEPFKARYLMPMGAAIWSSSTAEMDEFPAQFFVRFFLNHGLLSVNHQPTWRVLRGGSSSYIDPLSESFRHKVRLNDAVTAVQRTSSGVNIRSRSGSRDYDQVVFACHSDQALALLLDPTSDESALLSAIDYRENDVTLHTDTRFLPTRRRAWASWNYCLSGEPEQPPVLTYNMNMLQGITSPETFCVTLNAAQKIDPVHILGSYSYAHPVFTQAAIDAQGQWANVNGVHRTWYCGAYWHNGFHEDGVKSALQVAAGLGVDRL